ncbi:MAG: mannose-6-phosphate isomerase, class I [Spirochaetia bacterium]
MENTVQHYPWGSPDLMSRLLDIESGSEGPKAELWMGAHPKAPSLITCGGTQALLDDYINKNPESVIGKVSADRWGTLPFLFKVLTAGKSLSIQAHPDAEQARIGYDRENKAGIPLDAPNRNYRDPNHKPELICALTPFLALRGFRPIDEILINFPEQVFPDLSEAVQNLKENRNREALAGFFRTVMESPPDLRQRLIAGALKQKEHTDELTRRIISGIAADYPGDIGILGPLYLNPVELSPGRAMFLDAGELHAYIKGGGIEIMANSDNVLRGGSTRKHIDVPELMNVLTFDPGKPEILSPRGAGAVKHYTAPAPEFRLSVISLAGKLELNTSDSPEILLCTEGEFHASGAGDGKVRCARGHSLFITADQGSYTLSGEGMIFRAGTGAAERT